MNMMFCVDLCLQILALTSVLWVKAEQRGSRERHYYIAAVEIDWNYSSTQSFGQTYKKVVFREYEEGFREAKTHPSWLGLLGPTLRAEEGETLVVTFRNMASGEYSIHPHGIAYGKKSEGAYYFDNTSQKEKEDDVVLANQEHVYQWEVTSEISPQLNDPSCLTYSYISHRNVVEDYNSGLIGALLICKSGTLNASGQQAGIHHELVFLFGVFNEKQSKNMPKMDAAGDHIKYTINGYTKGSLPDVSICAHTAVSLHLLGMSSEPEIFSVHMNGQVLQQDGHKVSSVGLISGSSSTARMVAVYPGRWLLSSQTIKHVEAGLHGFVDVKKCEGFDAPQRKMTVAQKRESREWTYYIAAEEVIWDYAPNMPDHTDQDYKMKYLKKSSVRIGQEYKKAVFTLYKNESFTEKMETKQRRNELGILGPVIRAQIRDFIKIVFKNMASRPYSIYPHGLTIEKSQEGVNYPTGGNQSHGVQPGETHTYLWDVVEEDEPLDGDSRCLTRMYHSAVDTAHDIASGLIGPLLICKSQSLNVRNVQLKADKEQHAVFAVFDENKSWYLKENINQNCDQSKVNPADPEFYKSNIMHTINGYTFESGPLLGFCNGEVATWHVSSIGAQDYIQTATFYGHPFELNERTEDILSLYPMTGETITMNMDNIGVWLLASLSTHETTKGVRVKFQDVECFRDYTYEYEEDDEEEIKNEWHEWKPATLDDVKKEDTEKEKEKEVKEKTVQVDDDTDIFAEEWGLRSLKKQASDTEQLDLSFLDYDTVDAPSGHKDTLSISEKSVLYTTETLESNISMESAEILSGRLKRSFRDDTDNTIKVLSVINITDVVDFNLNNVTLFDKDNNASENFIAVVDIEEILTRGDVFSYDVPLISQNVPDSFQTDKARDDGVNGTSNNKSLETKNSSTFYPSTNVTGNEIRSTYLNVTANKTNLLQDNINSRLLEDILENVTNPDVSKEWMIKANFTETFKNLTNHTDTIKTTLEKVAAFNFSAVWHSLTNITSKAHQNSTLDAISSVTISDSLEHIRENASSFNTFNNDSTRTNITDFKTALNNMTNVNVSLGAVSSVTISDSLEHILENASSFNTFNNDSTRTNISYFKTALNNMTNVNVSLGAVSLGNTSEFLLTTLENAMNLNFSETTETNITHILKTSLVNITHFNSSEVGIPLMESLEIENSSLNTNVSNVQNITVNVSRLNATAELNFNSTENWTLAHGDLNQTAIVKNVSHELLAFNNSSTSTPFSLGATEELGGSESSEEVFIYLQENITEAIKSTSIKTQSVQNWTYDATHVSVPKEIPDHMIKYVGKYPSQSAPPPRKPLKKLTLRQKPHKGQGMKTKRRKEYVPQARSGLPFSPRGFNPGMSPRGSRPLPLKTLSDEEHLINNPIVIGVPRPEFSDYELYVTGDEPDHLGLDENQDVKADEYEYVSYKDPYRSHEDMKNFNLDEVTTYYLKNMGKNTKVYFIAAQEVEWDYAGYGHRREERTQLTNRETKFTKVVFRRYIDSSFTTPDIRGEINEHLGILGPLIKAEVGQDIMVVFKNNANRPYSLHPNGVSYTKQTEGLSYEDGSKYWHKYDNEVQPNKTFTYLWKVTPTVGPMKGESDCRTWAYYSGVNPERDIQSGLIGPLLVCREGTLNKIMTNVREFVLMFMTFDESQSWYYEKNLETIRKRTRQRSLSSVLKENFMFHTINGIIYSLKGLRMYTNQMVHWHLINMGSPKDFQSVHFHGQTFFHKKIKSYKQAVYPLLPGSFATLEMIPSKPGLWQLETEVGMIQQKGMQTLFLVLDDVCNHPLGLESGSVADSQITAINTRGSWEPHLARLYNAGKYNAWSTEHNNSWIQVDFQRPVAISQISTQGAKQFLNAQYVLKYAISYSNDRRMWIFYKGDSSGFRKIFSGNQEAYVVKTNTFFPPIVGRYIRLHPVDWYSKATVRMEYYGCELDGCSVPLGMESRLIQDHQITASSTASSWNGVPWKASLGRLNKQGYINAWQAGISDMNQWLQVELPQIKKITGIITQGAKTYGTKMYVISYSLKYSNDGLHWTDYTDDDLLTFKTFVGNTNNSDHVRNYIHPPIFSRFIRIIPQSWKNSITLRIELLGCDFE